MFWPPEQKVLSDLYPFLQNWVRFVIVFLQLIHIMGSLLERPAIAKDFEAKYPQIVTLMGCELDEAKALYDRQVVMRKEQGWAPVHKNMPKVSGSLRWAKELRDRISAPMGNFKHLEHP